MRIEIVDKPANVGTRKGSITAAMWSACLAAHADGKAVAIEKPQSAITALLKRIATKSGFCVRTKRVTSESSIAWLEKVQ